MGECVDTLGDGFVKPNEEILDQLGPGCFVENTVECGHCCWVEIVSGDDSCYECIAHPNLSDCTVQEGITEGSRMFVQREHITAVGCDRYCFC